jgi:hypothetical protein
MNIICGAYLISSKLRGKVYVGASIDIRARWVRHKSELKLKTHPNIKLQRHVDKYGFEDLQFQVLGELHQDLIFTIEPELIKRFDSLRNGFNLTDGGEGSRSNERKIKLKNIKTLQIREFRSVSEASRLIGTSISNIWYVIEKKGKGNRRICAGWCLPETDISNINMKASQKHFKVCHPECGEYEGWNQSEFCRKYNLNFRHFARLISGDVKTCHKWKLIPLS